jgi:pimeloyl-ACP methyl ester carboxylesterase
MKPLGKSDVIHLHIIPECGHYAPLERPDALNQILRDVITEHQC